MAHLPRCLEDKRVVGRNRLSLFSCGGPGASLSPIGGIQEMQRDLTVTNSVGIPNWGKNLRWKKYRQRNLSVYLLGLVE